MAVMPFDDSGAKKVSRLVVIFAASARAGFTTQYDIDVTARRVDDDGVILMSRRHIDGYAFAVPDRLLKFFDVATVRDAARP